MTTAFLSCFGSEAEEISPRYEDIPENDSEEDTPAFKRLEDYSEDDFDEIHSTDEETPPEDVSELVKNWLTASKNELLKGGPLKCRLCPNALILNGRSLQQHAESKTHKSRVARDSERSGDLFFLAKDASKFRKEEEAETHQERLERIQKLVRDANEKKSKTKSLRARGKRAGKRPGKRQREAFKQQHIQEAETK